MALSNQRFVTSWTSEDKIDYKLIIIPSSVNYVSSGISSDVILPNEFLLRDMTLDTELGSIPSGMVSQVLKINVNIASLQGTNALNDLRTDLLRGTTVKKVPLNSDGTEYLATELTQEEREFDSFNTFVLKYNDGTGWKVSFIGCQKYSAENELEITSLDNVMRFSIEIFDINRCIGEMINENIWKKALACNDDTVNYSVLLSQPENTEIREMFIGYPYINEDKTDGSISAKDYLLNDSFMYISTFERLKEKISNMYSAYLRAITQKLTSSFVADSFYSKNIVFKENQANVQITQPYLCYVAEIWLTIDGNLSLAGGAHADTSLFAQFTNFFEVYKNIIEGSLETLRISYSFTNGTPDAYTLTMVADNPYSNDYQVTFDQDNTYSSLKIKMFSETLNQATVSVSSITGEEDTKSFEYGENGTSGDNSKDLKIMFHNLPIITYRNSYIDENGQLIWARYTINGGTILYSDIYGFTKPQTPVDIYFGAESFSLSVPPSLYLKVPEYQMLLEQQYSGLPTTVANGLVHFLGRSKQAEATFTSTYTNAKGTLVAKRCIIDLADYNSLLQSIYNSSTAYAVMTKHSHKVYEGTADIVLRIDAEAE